MKKVLVAAVLFSAVGFAQPARRDPFQGPGGRPPPSGECKTRACRFDLGDFRLVGTVTGTSEARAMVMDPEGTGLIVRTGMQLGREKATVVKITAEALVLEAVQPDGKKARLELKLPVDASDVMPENLLE